MDGNGQCQARPAHAGMSFACGLGQGAWGRRPPGGPFCCGLLLRFFTGCSGKRCRRTCRHHPYSGSSGCTTRPRSRRQRRPSPRGTQHQPEIRGLWGRAFGVGVGAKTARHINLAHGCQPARWSRRHEARQPGGRTHLAAIGVADPVGVEAFDPRGDVSGVCGEPARRNGPAPLVE